ncbi:RNA polymerase sigma factor RpoD/SigA [Elusimicrobiota bacterium]
MVSSLDSIKLYLKEVARIPMISQEEMKRLVPKLKKGSEKAKQRLIHGNLRLVISIAKRYVRPGVEINDLIETGNIGLIAASNRYDPTKGTKFSTYAHDWIKEYIRRATLHHSKAVHIPVYVYQNFQKIMKAWDSIFKITGIAPTAKELAKKTGFRQKEIKNSLYYIKVFSDIPSLDAPISNDIDIPLKATIAAVGDQTPEDAVGIMAMHQEIEELLENVTEREKEVIKLRFGVGASHPHTLQDVGEKLNISRERVRQIQDKALSKLRKAAVKLSKNEEK